MDLDKIAIDCGTDKSSLFHNYAKIYEKLIGRKYCGAMLEIGVYKCQSLNMWKEYFKNGSWNIYGVDINPECKQYEKDNVKICICDQKTFDTDLKFDFIVDDGSHNPNDFIDSFSRLWSNVKRGGFYAIEDLSTCNHPKYPNSWEDRFREFYNSFIYSFNTGAGCILKDLENIELYRKLIVFRKKP